MQDINLKDYTPGELQDKIEAEGGVDQFFLWYDNDWSGTDIETYVDEFQNAYLDLVSALQELGLEVTDE